MFIFRNTLRKHVSFRKISLLTFLSSLYDCWCFKATQANRVNLSASLISWQKSGEKNYKQWAFRIGISHCAEFKSVPLSPTAPPWTWLFLANLSIPHTMVQREPLLLGPLLLCLGKMFAYSKIHKNFQWKFSKWNTLKDKNTLDIISDSMAHDTGANYVYRLAEVTFTPSLRSTFPYTMSLKWSLFLSWLLP